MIAHGTRKPADIHNFLYPVYQELIGLVCDGLDIQCGNDRFNAKVYLLTFTGDIPAVADIANHSSYMSKYGCRICTIQGVKNGGMYFRGNAALPTKRNVGSFQTDEETVSSILILISKKHILTFFF
jgi:hypothetical protein